MQLQRSEIPGTPTKVMPSIVAGCINEHPMSGLLIRTVRNRATEWQVPWAIIYVETPEHYELSSEQKEDIIRTLSRAEQMGAQVYHTVSPSVIKGIQEFVEKNAVSDIFVGTSTKDMIPFNYFSVFQGLKKYSNLFTTHPVNLEWRSGVGDWRRLLEKIKSDYARIKWRSYIYSTAALLLATLLGEAAYQTAFTVTGHHMVYNVSLLFMLASIMNAFRYGLMPGLFSGFLSAIMINFFYLQPRFELHMRNSQDLVNLGLFIVATVMASRIGANSYRSIGLSKGREERIQTLYRLTKILVANRDPKELHSALVCELDNILETETYIFLAEVFTDTAGLAQIQASIQFSEDDVSALKYCWENREPSGIGTFRSSSSSYHFEPMVTSSGIIGVLSVKMQPHTRDDLSYIRFVSVLADQSAQALERVKLIAEMEEARVQQEREKLRSSLLSSVSHDLKTPLASIIGSLSALRHMEKTLSQEARATLLETALDEAERLNSFITNILNMTRLESGAVKLRKTWVEPDMLIADMLKRMQQRMANHEIIHLTLPGHFQVELDAALFELLFSNLVDNAAKYSPSGSKIIVSSGVENRANGPYWKFMVTDEGPGIDEKDRDRIFNKFTRLEKKDSQVAGTGLGLAICKAVAQAHGGDISVNTDENGKGSVFSATLGPGRYMENIMEPPTKKVAKG